MPPLGGRARGIRASAADQSRAHLASVASGLEATSRRLATACNDEDVDVQALVWEAMEVAVCPSQGHSRVGGALGRRVRAVCVSRTGHS